MVAVLLRSWLLLLALCGVSRAAQAQYEFNAWRFGANAGLQFPSTVDNGPPVATTGRVFSIEGCASMADSAGTLQCSTDGETVWNRQGQIMPNGRLVSGNSSNAAQGPMLLQHPGRRNQYFLFTVDAALTFIGGLRYSVVDMARAGGLGEVLMPSSVRVPAPTRNYVLTEALTAVRHANGTDYWVVVHGWQNNEFLSYRVSPAGLDTVPVQSLAGRVHGPTGPAVTSFGRVAMRASPDGRRLAAGVPNQGVEVFDFDNLTGRVNNAQPVPTLLVGNFSGYGLEFSANSNVLYTADLGGRLFQIDLRNLSVLQLGNSTYAALQRGPDNRIYIANYQARTLGIIVAPNVVGVGCTFLAGSQDLAGHQSLYGLPNYPNQPPRPTRIVAPRGGCVGQLVTFAAEGFLVTGTGQQWDFGDPASGPANTATGNPVTHRYPQPGVYSVALTLNTVIGAVRRTQQIQVSEVPTLRLLPRDTLICEQADVLLHASPQPPGTTFRWQDGSTEPSFRAQAAGRYTLEVRNAGGCLARDSVFVSTRACFLPNIITPNGDPFNQTFVLKGLRSADWDIRLYNRWGLEIYSQEKYDNTWAAAGQPDGVYYYYLSNHATGQKYKGWVEVRR